MKTSVIGLGKLGAPLAAVLASKGHEVIGVDVNPDFVRWELHRVWVVEGTLKPGNLHVYSKRVFYLDEDSWAALASDQYDMKGQLYRSSFAFQSYSYDVQAPFNDTLAIYDFSMGVYNFAGPFKGLKYMTQLPSKTAYAPNALAGGGLR